MSSLMFSGIIEELGEVRNISRVSALTVLTVKADKVLGNTKVGDSVSVNGACLTTVGVGEDSLKFEVMPQTLKATNLGQLKLKDKVNLERALRAGDRISGHFVTGHVDCAGIIRNKGFIQGNPYFEITVLAEFMKYILPKGSIAVDGISLTIGDRKPGSFTVYIIPHTLKNTTLGFKGPSDKVNVECDILAKKS